MTQDEKDAANAALLLEEKINERVWAAIQDNPHIFVSVLEHLLKRQGPHSVLALELSRLVAPHIFREEKRYNTMPYYTSREYI
jgi:hypothetical protein